MKSARCTLHGDTPFLAGDVHCPSSRVGRFAEVLWQTPRASHLCFSLCCFQVVLYKLSTGGMQKKSIGIQIGCGGLAKRPSLQPSLRTPTAQLWCGTGAPAVEKQILCPART